MAEDRGFLARWSDRKRQAEAGAAAPEPGEPAAADVLVEQEAAANCAAAEAVDLEALDRDSDYTVFLKRGVPDALRRRALRRLWRSDPVLACLDGLNDYEENFADPALNMAVFKSAWQAGRGYLADDAPATTEAAAPVESAETPGAAEVEAEPEAIAAPHAEREIDPPPAPEPAVHVSLRRRLGLDEG